MLFLSRKRKRRGIGAAVATIALLTAGCGGDAAGDSDSGSIDHLETVIVQSAGGGTDVLARAILEKFVEPELDGVRFLTRNEEGDAGLLGLNKVERSDSGDAVIGFVNTTTTYAQYARGEDAPVDMRDMTPIAGYGTLPSVVAVNADLGVETFDDLVALYEGEDLPYGGTSAGGASELSANLMKSEYGLGWDKFIAYDGSGELMAAIARGEVPAGNLSDTSAADALQAETAVPVLNLGSVPSPVLPDVPTAASLDLPQIISGENVRLIVASSNIDDEVREQLVTAFEKALTSEEAQAWSEENNIGLSYIPPDEVTEVLETTFAEIESVPGVEEILVGE